MGYCKVYVKVCKVIATKAVGIPAQHEAERSIALCLTLVRNVINQNIVTYVDICVPTADN